MNQAAKPATFLVCHVGAASPCGDSCLRIAEQGFGSYKYMILMPILKFLSIDAMWLVTFRLSAAADYAKHLPARSRYATALRAGGQVFRRLGRDASPYQPQNSYC